MQSENLIRATHTSKKTVAFAKPLEHRKNALKSYILQKFMIFCPFRIADFQWECIFIFGQTSHIKTWNANETNILIKQMQIIDIHNEYLVVGPTGIFVFYSSTFPLHNVCVWVLDSVWFWFICGFISPVEWDENAKFVFLNNKLCCGVRFEFATFFFRMLPIFDLFLGLVKLIKYI